MANLLEKARFKNFAIHNLLVTAKWLCYWSTTATDKFHTDCKINVKFVKISTLLLLFLMRLVLFEYSVNLVHTNQSDNFSTDDSSSLQIDTKDEKKKNIKNIYLHNSIPIKAHKICIYMDSFVKWDRLFFVFLSFSYFFGVTHLFVYYVWLMARIKITPPQFFKWY